MTTLPNMPPLSSIKFKPGSVAKGGSRALGLAYVDSRDCYNALDQHAPGWSTQVTQIHQLGSAVHVAVSLTVDGITRTDCGTGGDAPEAYAQAVKRAAAQHGLFRGLYDFPSTWAEYDSERKQFTPAGQEALRRALCAMGGHDAPDVAQLRRQFDDLGQRLYGDQWPSVCERNCKRVSNGQTELIGDLTAAQLEKLISGLQKLEAKRKLAA